MRQQGKVMAILFCSYLLILAYLVLFSQEFGRVATTREYNLILFDTIKSYYTYRHTFGEVNFYTNIYGNILAFMPLGYFVYIYQKKKRLILGLIIPMALSGLIEYAQYRFSVGSFDVDDIFLNTLGGVSMYLVIYIPMAIRRRMKVYSKNNAARRNRK